MKYPRIYRDHTYKNMFRVFWSKEDYSDLVNLSRAKDAVNKFLEETKNGLL